MMMKGPFREIIPIGAQKVRIRVPKGRKAAGAKLLVANQAVAISSRGDSIEVLVPSIKVHEVVAIDLL
jgi:hypothetical protein